MNCKEDDGIICKIGIDSDEKFLFMINFKDSEIKDENSIIKNVSKNKLNDLYPNEFTR